MSSGERCPNTDCRSTDVEEIYEVAQVEDYNPRCLYQCNKCMKVWVE